MNEKRFQKTRIVDKWGGIYDSKTDEVLNVNDVEHKLNEQQELIEELHISDHMGWGRAEKFEKELKQKKIYIKRLEYKVQKFKEMNGEQQATIKSKDKQLERLYNYFQDYLKDEMSGNAFSEMWDFVKEDEKWEDE